MAQQPDASVDPLVDAGQRLRQAREARGLNLRQLALETRISSPVLEALERGWRDRLPEATYLRTMLHLLEEHLSLPSGSLEAALPAAATAAQKRGKTFVVFRFTPGSIDVFTTWQGTWIYAVLCLGLVYGLNLEQQRLAAAGLLALRPVAPLATTKGQGRTESTAEGTAEIGAAQDPDSTSDSGAKEKLESLYPDLRPLDQASRGQGLRLLGKSSRAVAAGESGQLLIRLAQPSQVQLQTAGGVRVTLAGSQGELLLPVTTPFRLSLRPPPAGQSQTSAAAPGSVEWNGQELQPLAGHRDQFALP